MKLSDGELLKVTEQAFARALIEEGIGRKQSAFDGNIQPSDQQNPDKGIICPWNETAEGPAMQGVPFCEPHQKYHLHCGVYKNLDDFDRWASEYRFRFCLQLCQKGRNPEQTKRAKEIHDRQFNVPGWMKRMSGGVPEFMRLPVVKRLP